MAIADKLKKAAGLFIQFDEPAESDAPHASTEASGGSAGEDDIDKRLAAMSAELSGASPTAPPQTVAQVVKASAGPNLEEIKVSAGDVAPGEGGAVDFLAVYKAANLPSSTFSAEQTLKMIDGLPASLPLDVKRQSVGVMIQSMGGAIGASAETIVADASRKLAALAAYSSDIHKTTEDYAEKAQAEVARLTAEIERHRTTVLDAQNRATGVIRSCEAEADRLDDILEFFSLDIGPSVHAPEKS